MVQPLSRVKPGAKITVSPVALQMRPLLAATVMQVIGVWSDTEGDIATLLSAMTKSDIAVGAAMYLSVTTRRARLEVLQAAAEQSLSGEDCSLLRAVLRAMKPSYQQRDQFAHRVWAFSDDLPDALLLVPPEDVTRITVERRQHIERAKVPVSVEDGQVRYAIPVMPPGRLDPARIAVYRHADLERALTDAGEANYLVQCLYHVAAGGVYEVESRRILAERLSIS